MGTKLIIHLHINGHTEFLQKEQAENDNTEIDEQQSCLITVCHTSNPSKEIYDKMALTEVGVSSHDNSTPLS